MNAYGSTLERPGDIRILVVDDEEGVRQSLRGQLLRAGYEVVTANTGEEAIRRFRYERMSVVLLDIFLPGKDGFETLMDIRRCMPEARVITMSGHSEYRGIDLLRWSKKLGAMGALRKPFGGKELVKTVNTVLSQDITPRSDRGQQ